MASSGILGMIGYFGKEAKLEVLYSRRFPRFNKALLRKIAY
jgi:hypothetical protein